MKAIEFKFEPGYVHRCYADKDLSGRYYSADPVDRLVEAAKKVVRIIDHDAHIKAVFELEAALAPFLEE